MFIHKVLDKDRLKVLEKLRPFLKEYPICGGTGLALHLGHRISYDFDLFGEQNLPKFLDKRVQEVFTDSNIIRSTSDELTLFSSNQVKVTFLYYPFKKLEPDFMEEGVYTGSLSDLIANKFYVIGRRAEIRDYIDIYNILKIKSLDECLNLSILKYGNLLSKKTILGQLKYVEDLDFQDPVFLVSKLTKEELINFLSEKAEEYLKNS